MRSWDALLVLASLGCAPPAYAPAAPPAYATMYEPAYALPPDVSPTELDRTQAGGVVDRFTDVVFDGGYLEFELRRDDDRVYEVARNHYAVAMVVRWTVEDLDNLEQAGPLEGVIMLPAATAPNAPGRPVALGEHRIADPRAAFRRRLRIHARFGDPRARPASYAYRLPYRAGSTFSVLQGFHGGFSHLGSNEYAVDFDCPVATPVLAARAGLVVAANATAQGAGVSPEFQAYPRTNFVLVLHEDGTIGEYMHLAPSGVRVSVGQRVERGDELALSGNTGYSSTPHLHFQVMTAAEDGVNARSFPFELAVAPDRAEPPMQGRAYAGWE